MRARRDIRNSRISCRRSTRPSLARRIAQLAQRGARSTPFEARCRSTVDAMRATFMYAAGDVRVEDVPDPSIVEPTDAIIRITSACVCGSDLWPYADLE